MTAVHEVMSTSPITVAPTTSVGDLLTLFDRHDFNAFPVLDRREQLVGIVSKLDVLQLFLAEPSTPAPAEGASPVRVADFMRHTIVSIKPTDSIVDAGALMVDLKLRSLPVVEGAAGPSRLVGILSRGDILRGLRFQLIEGHHSRQVPGS
jgi:CBS domain-containing protein